MVWLNTNCDNSEGNQCVCPYCRWERETGFSVFGGPYEVSEEWKKIFHEWEHRNDKAEQRMRDRYPKD